MTFVYSAKVDFLFGQGASAQLGEQLTAMGCKKVMCVCDKGIKQAGIVAPLVKNMEDSGIIVVEFDGVLADPPDSMVNECAEIGRKEAVDGVVGIGGGSSLDTAKAVNVLLSNPGKIEQYLASTGNSHQPSKSLILIPTTAGTASEVTYVAVITNTEKQIKDGLNGPATVATLAIVDPVLTKGMPPAITASTGMDALAHALEAYTTMMASPMTDMLAEKSIEMVIEYLPKAYVNGEDLEAREKMSYACLLAGESFNNAFVHFGHAFGQGFGALHHIPHGIGCAIGQPAVVEIAADIFPDKVRKIGKMFGLELSESMSSKELGDKVGEKIKAFGKGLGIPGMSELGIKKSDLEDIAKKTMEDMVFALTPKQLSYDDVLALVTKLYD